MTVSSPRPGWAAGSVEVNGVTIHYHRTGGNKPPVVLLHGMSDNGLCWTRVAMDLEKDFDVIMIDARGHGASVIERSDFSFDIMAADVAGVIDALGLDKPILVGHSMGGQVATVVAARYPGKVSRIALEDPAYFVRPAFRFLVRFFLPFVLASARRTARKPIEQVMARCRKQNPSWSDVDVVTWAPAQVAFGRNLTTGKLEKISLKVDWHATFPGVACPVLLVIPSNGMMSLDTAKSIATEFPRARVAFIDGAGHSVRREQYAAYMDALIPFCKGVEAVP